MIYLGWHCLRGLQVNTDSAVGNFYIFGMEMVDGSKPRVPRAYRGFFTTFCDFP